MRSMGLYFMSSSLYGLPFKRFWTRYRRMPSRCTRGSRSHGLRPSPWNLLRGAAPPTRTGPRDDLRRLLEDLGDGAGADRAAALADGEAELLLERDGLDEDDLDAGVVARHAHLRATLELDGPVTSVVRR